MRQVSVVVVCAAVTVAGGAGGCNGRGGGEAAPLPSVAGLIGSPADSAPSLTFTQNALTVGLSRANEPGSASSCPNPTTQDTLSYGTWLSDLDGDGRLDAYDVNHGQACHRSGLWVNGGGSGAGAFGKNLWTVAMGPAPSNGANLGISNEMMFIGDLSGDGKVDLYFLDWGGLGAACINQGNAAHSDWIGPSFLCYSAWAPQTFADVNGDGRIDVEVLDPAFTYDVYKERCRTQPTTWKLNNGNPNINTWPSDANPFHFVGQAAAGALLDFNKDGLPDRIQGVEVASNQRGLYGTSSGGLRVSLGQANGTYQQVTSGLESVTDPVVRLEDIDEDGCIDVGTDITGYRDNQRWFLQDRSGSSCLATFRAVARTALPYHPGARRYTFDADNDGLLDKAVIIHNGYGNNDGKAGGVHIFRRLTSGAFSDLGALGININGTSATEFYADQLNPGDWNDDGKVDLAGAGQSSIAGTDAGIALWTSNLSTSNRYLKVKTPAISGFFTGTAKIELFDAGFAGDSAHYVTPPKLLRTGEARASQVHHFGVGTRATVDVRVSFPGGQQTTQAAVATNGAVTVQPTPNLAPNAVATATPTAAAIGEAVSFDGSGSSDPDGTVTAYSWTFGDGATASGATPTHAYATAGTFVATLTVRDGNGATATATVSIAVSDNTPPTLAIGSVTFTPAVSDDVGVASVRWSVDGVVQAQPVAAPFAFTVSVAPLAAGTHTVSCQAFDPSGNASPSVSMSLVK